MKGALAILAFVMIAMANHAYGKDGDARRYSQSTLLKNWALSRCLGQVYADCEAQADANASASAYLEFGRQPIQAYEALGATVDKYVRKKYSSSVGSELNTMKCIDLFHSKELEDASRKYSVSR